VSEPLAVETRAVEPPAVEPRAVPEGAEPGRPSTGHPLVDEVVASLDRLCELPVTDHVAIFESAHDRLRGILADPGSGPAEAAVTGGDDGRPALASSRAATDPAPS
jgi:hypothetical protein